MTSLGASKGQRLSFGELNILHMVRVQMDCLSLGCAEVDLSNRFVIGSQRATFPPHQDTLS